MKPVYLLLLLLAGTVAASAQPLVAYHTTLIGHVNPTPGAPKCCSSLTGYVAPDGREYALLGGIDATYVYDVTDAPIRLVAELRGPHAFWREIKTYRHYAYVVVDQSTPGNGLQIIDLSTLPDTARVLREDTTLFEHAHTVTREGDYLYVNGTWPADGFNGGTLIFDLSSDPLHPVLVGTYTLRYVHDATVRNDTLYAAAINDGQFDVVYLGKDRKEPKLVAEIRYPGAVSHSSDVTIDGNYLLTTDEIFLTPTLKVWDVRDVNDITKVADYTPAPGELIHNVHVKGSIAYVSWYTAGTRIVDVSDPRDPAQIGYYDTHDSTHAAPPQGNWEVYPYLPSGKILASDMVNGLFVFTFDGVKKGAISGRVLDAETGEPIAGASIELPTIRLWDTCDVNGAYTFSGAADTLRAVVSAAGYVTLVDSLMPTPTGSVRDFRLQPIGSGVDQMHAGGGRSIELSVEGREGWVTIDAARYGRLRVELINDLGAVACLTDVAPGNTASRMRLDLDGLAAGLYFWRALDGSGVIVGGGPLILR